MVILVLAELIQGKRRFNELRRNLGNVNTKGLTDTLRHLEESGMISRKVFPTVPVTVEYELTEKGKEFHGIFKEMAAWGKMASVMEPFYFAFVLRFQIFLPFGIVIMCLNLQQKVIEYESDGNCSI